MIIWFCPSCREEVKHKVEDMDTKRYQDHKIIICQECGEKHMIPEKALESKEAEREVEVKSVSVDSERNIDDGCESGLCPSR